MNKIICIAGRSGTGKTTLSWKLSDTLQSHRYNAGVIVSSTTRPKRDNEVDGIDHKFCTNADYDAAKDIVAETVYGSYKYWTTINDFNKYINIYVIDEDGIRYLRKRYGRKFDIITVRIDCNDDELERRGISVERRNRDPKSKLHYDYLFINNDESDAQYICNRLIRDLKLNKI